MKDYDVVIIGAGPGGYVAAIRAGQSGLKTAIVERENLGGTCLNWGCIPTKALLRNAEIIGLLKEGKTFGFSFDENSLTVDYAAAQKRSREVAGKLSKGVEYLMKKNKVDVYKGTGRLKDKSTVEVTPEGASAGAAVETLIGKNIIIATGSKAFSLPGLAVDGIKVLTARQALELKNLPKSIAVAGAGAIGMEFASVWNAYGVEVTVVEMMPQVLPLEDADIGGEVRKQYAKAGIKILTGTKIESIKTEGPGVELSVSGGGGAEAVKADLVLMALGVRPLSADMGIESAGIATEKGYITVDDMMSTNVPGVYAIGDVTGKLPLAHVASAQALVAVDHLAGKSPQPLNYTIIPKCTYGKPETASAGLTEKQAKDRGYKVKTGSFPFQVNGKAIAYGDTAGFVKIVSEEEYGEILGVHMVGPHVTEMIAGSVGFMFLEGTLDMLAKTVHPHPTLSEVIMEAAHAVEGAAIHI